MDENNLVKKAKALGDYLKKKLEQLSYPFIKEVRGCGLMLGMQMKSLDESMASPDLVDTILEEMKDRGFIIGKNGMGRNVLAFQPPLVISKEDIDHMIINLEEVFDKLTF